ncbi:hypothetical protein [Micromonospora sp. RTP1Z1]|uniref:hypothetical protein n=1 Tax=Micromonospora sp. RTP1Z1 TaxID=2994043 RepID=UPI0029C87799|nr:hypothetical protein [Micromonospora sp. RTP1Z1]
MSAILSLIRPQSEHIRVDGKNRSTRAKARPYRAALYSNMILLANSARCHDLVPLWMDDLMRGFIPLRPWKKSCDVDAPAAVAGT